MATNILMPALSPTMTEGTLARWLKKEGDAIRAGDVIAEIETDKATMEVEAVDEGVLGKILVPDGTAGVQVNAPIGVLVIEGEAAPAGEAGRAGAGAAPKPDPAPAGGETAAPVTPVFGAGEPRPAPVPIAQAAPGTAPGTAPGGGPGSGPASSATPVRKANGHATPERVFASPLARRMARQAGIELSMLRGSGPNGRIVRADVEAAQRGDAQPAAASAAPAQIPPAQAQAPAPAPAPAAPAARPAAPISAPHQLVPHSSMRRVIARRLTEAKQTIPHFYASIDVELDAMLKLRGELNRKSPREGAGAFKLSVNDLVIKAVAATLRRVPRVNACWTDDGVALFSDVDISVAVSIPDGLITPIIRRADQKGLAAISNEMKELAGRARAGKLKPEEFQGGTFSVSNMGMYGVSSFSSIINPPQAGILAVAAGQERPVVRDGALAIATVMTCTISVDHRAVDGALAAEWLAEFKRVVEDPLSLML